MYNNNKTDVSYKPTTSYFKPNAAGSITVEKEGIVLEREFFRNINKRKQLAKDMSKRAAEAGAVCYLYYESRMDKPVSIDFYEGISKDVPFLGL